MFFKILSARKVLYKKVLFFYPYGAVYSIGVRCFLLCVVLIFFSKGDVLSSVSFFVAE